MLSSSKDNSNRLWDLRLGKPLRRFKGHQNTSKNFIRSAFGPNERYAFFTDEVLALDWRVVPILRRVAVLFRAACWGARLFFLLCTHPRVHLVVLVHACHPSLFVPGCFCVGTFAAWSLAAPKTACSTSGTWTPAVSSRHWAPVLGRFMSRSGTHTRACWRPVDTTALSGPGGTMTTRRPRPGAALLAEAVLLYSKRLRLVPVFRSEQLAQSIAHVVALCIYNLQVCHWRARYGRQAIRRGWPTCPARWTLETSQ